MKLGGTQLGQLTPTGQRDIPTLAFDWSRIVTTVKIHSTAVVFSCKKTDRNNHFFFTIRYNSVLQVRVSRKN